MERILRFNLEFGNLKSNVKSAAHRLFNVKVGTNTPLKQWRIRYKN